MQYDSVTTDSGQFSCVNSAMLEREISEITAFQRSVGMWGGEGVCVIQQ